MMNTPNDHPAIQVQRLRFGFRRGIHIFSELGLNLERGEICAVLGRNGCGKSTFLQCLYGILEAEAERLHLLGLDPRAQPAELRQRVGYVPQVPQFDEAVSVRAHLDFLRPLYDGRWNISLEEELLEDFGLREALATDVGKLSLGQQRQLSFVVALAFEPELLLLDEPAVHLDTVIRRRFAHHLVEFMARPGRTILMASHLIHEVERIADRVVIMADRQFAVDSSLDRLKQNLFCFEARFPHPVSDLIQHVDLVMEHWNGKTVSGAAWTDTSTNSEDVTRRLNELGAAEIHVVDSALEDIFVHFTSGF